SVRCGGKGVRVWWEGQNGGGRIKGKGKVKRCAARSVCGKEGFVTCQIPQLGTCDPTTNLCVEDPSIPCTAAGVCILGTSCKIKHSADLCMARGGAVGVSPTCCSDCVVAPPAP